MLKRLPGFSLLTTLFLIVCFLPGYAGLLLFWIAAMVLVRLATHEMAVMMERMRRPVIYSCVCRAGWLWMTGVVLCLLQYVKVGRFDHFLAITEPIAFIQPQYIAIAGLFLMALPWIALPIYGVGKQRFGLIVDSVAAFAMVALPLSALVPLYMLGSSEGLVVCPLFLYLVAVTKMGDTGAYLVGSLSNKLTKGGNHKIAPNISPNKSWEGALGGMVASVGMSMWLGNLFFELPWVVPLVLGVLLFWGGYFGDLAESAIKRSAEVKDSGMSIPGLGGALDFLDALFINAPLFLLVVWVLNSWIFPGAFFPMN